MGEASYAIRTTVGLDPMAGSVATFGSLFGARNQLSTRARMILGVITEDFWLYVQGLMIGSSK